MIDLSDSGGTDVFQTLKGDPNITILPSTTGQTRLLRMRVDMKPWSDNRVRMALKLCQHREKILSLAYFGQGMQGHDFHVSPIHPEYCEKPVPKYDPEKAKQLLKKAGYPDGLEVNLAVGSGWSDVVRYAEVLKEDAAPAGLRINIQTMPTSQYWEKWTEVDLGITPWTHRPLGTMVLNLAYRSLMMRASRFPGMRHGGLTRNSPNRSSKPMVPWTWMSAVRFFARWRISK